MSTKQPPSHEVHSLFAWAERAAKLRFGPTTTLAYEDGACAIYCTPHDAPRKLLGTGPTWPDAMTEAVKKNTDIPQPPMEVEPEKAPEGEEHIEEFCQAMRRRDLPSEFMLWYGVKHDKNPEGAPRALYRHEWLQEFGVFIGEVLEK